ncbi:MAG TPA: cupredoxin domain-containing protein [Chloroflexota bacterium]|nr:cupredoxin domain-containing protein [Chloroflexota bacterium]
MNNRFVRFSAAEIVGFILAIIVVGIMGVIVFHGPFRMVNLGPAHASSLPAIHVRIETDAKTIGRYVPASVTVHPGQDVIFTNVSNTAHTVTADNFSFDSGTLDVGSSWTYIAHKAGTFRYSCVFHPRMIGTIIVRS